MFGHRPNDEKTAEVGPSESITVGPVRVDVFKLGGWMIKVVRVITLMAVVVIGGVRRPRC